jgi:hypothetical protein
MMLTPRQIMAYQEFNEYLKRADLADRLAINAIGAQGDKQSIEKTFKDLSG